MHDVVGTMDDHHAPIKGNIDFTKLNPYLHENVIKILEAHVKATYSEVKNALEYLRDLYGD